MPSDDLGAGDGRWVGGRLGREGIYAYIQLTHAVVQQKLKQHCTAIILQLKSQCVFEVYFTYIINEHR